MPFTAEELINDNLRTSHWLGEVVDADDPKMDGRLKVKVFGKFDLLEDEFIPWARAQNRITGGSATGSGFHSSAKKGSIVGVKFDNGNVYEPEWYMIQHISDELKEEISNSYTNAHSLIYDTETEGSVKVFFTEEKGLMLDYKETQVNIKPDNSILIQNPNGDSVEITNAGECTVKVSNNIRMTCVNATIVASKKAWIDSPRIELGKKAIEHVILGDTFQKLFNQHVHIGNQGIATSPPSIPLNGSELSQTTYTE
jgi:hypothetical protein